MIRRARTLRNCGLVAVLVVCTFTWVAVLSFDPADWPNTSVWPRPTPLSNACGRAGAWIAFNLFYHLGAGVYVLVGVLTVGALVRLAGQRMGEAPLRLAGLCLLVTVTAACSAMIGTAGSEGLLEGPGGILGIAVASVLTSYFSKIGASLFLAAAAIVGLLLMSDDLLLRLPRDVVGLCRKGVRTIDAMRRAGLRRPALVPTLMGAGTVSSTSRPSRPAKGGGGAGTGATNESASAGTDDAEEDEVATNGRPEAEADDGELDRDDKDDAYEEEDGDELEDDEEAEDDEDADEEEEREGDQRRHRRVPERELIIRMLGKDRTPDKLPKSPWPKELGDYVLPPLSLLRDPDPHQSADQETVVRDQAATLERTLAEFRVDVRVVEIDTGPVITMFELDIAAGTKVSQISSLANDIARALKATAVRVVAPLPGKNTVGIEVPNPHKEVVCLKELITLSGVKATKMALPVFIGKNASGDPLIGNIANMPHLLVAGTTGSGKSVAINALIMSLLMTQRPDHVKLILVDPKMVELSVFKDVPHLMCPIVTDMQQAELILEWAATKMDERYELLAEAGVKDIGSFNRLGKEEVYRRFQPTTEEERLQIPTHLPYIVIIIDELADLMMTSGKEVEHHLSRLAQKSRAVGVHLVVATQRPQANVVTGLVKSNLPCRIAFRVASRMDSRIVLDQNGAEVLLGEGDMLYLPPGSSKLLRAQGTYLADDELRAVLADLASKAKPEYHHELQRLRPDGDPTSGERDPLFDRAVDIIVETQRGSVSLLQRRMEVGYSRASRLIDQMAAAGIVGEYKGSQAREVLLTQKEWDRIRKQRDREIASGGYEVDLGSSRDDALSDPHLLDQAEEISSAAAD